MDDECLYKFCYSCSDNERLQVSQSCDRLHNIMKDSETPGDDIHSDLQIKLESDPTYQGKDLKNLNRWIPSYLVRETEEKHKNEDGTEKSDAIELRMKDTCDERADEWADNVLGRLTCLTR